MTTPNIHNRPESPLISIIVPVYNVEKYISKCIDSIINQDYANLEIILVNDGATDNSGKICDEFANKDSRIKVIHKKNEGVSLARNEGLSHAKGEFISFIDSDDYVDKDFISTLVEGIRRDGSDMIISGHTKVTDSSSSLLGFPDIIITSDDFSKLFTEYNLQMRSSPWGKLFKRSILRNNKLSFKQDIHLGEDIIFVFDYLRYCRSISFSSSTGYYYIQRSNSLTKSLNSYSSEIKGLFEYNNSKKSLITKFNLSDSAQHLLNTWEIIFLDRVKISILCLEDKAKAKKLLSGIDWQPLRIYKQYHSFKERLWDSLLWNKFYSLFIYLASLHS